MVDAHAITVEMSEGTGGRGLYGFIAHKLGIPYLKERETERLLRTRHEGKWVQSPNSGGKAWDSGKDYAEEFFPDSYNTIEQAMEKLGRPQAMWFCTRQLTLVIMDEKQKVGIKANSFTQLGMPRRGRVITLIEGLARKMELDG